MVSYDRKSRGREGIAGDMAKTAKRRAGRPTKPAVGTARVSLGLKVTAKTKLVVEALATASGRTQSQEAEFLIERALQIDEAHKSLGTTLESIKTTGIEAMLAREGWRVVRMRDQDENAAYLWAPPGHTWNPRSGFLSEEELKTGAWKSADQLDQLAAEEKAKEAPSKPEPRRKAAVD
jgi:hypothetical protein